MQTGVETGVILMWVITNISAYSMCCERKNTSSFTIWPPPKIFPRWCYQMVAFSALLALCEGNPPVTGGFLSQRPGTLSFDVCFFCAWTNGWANNRDAGDLRRHRAHYVAIVMQSWDNAHSEMIWWLPFPLHAINQDFVLGNIFTLKHLPQKLNIVNKIGFAAKGMWN